MHLHGSFVGKFFRPNIIFVHMEELKPIMDKISMIDADLKTLYSIPG